MQTSATEEVEEEEEDGWGSLMRVQRGQRQGEEIVGACDDKEEEAAADRAPCPSSAASTSDISREMASVTTASTTSCTGTVSTTADA